MQLSIVKSALFSNAIFSVVSGGVLLTLAQSIADLIGIGDPLLYQVVGAGLIGFAGVVGWVGTRSPINPFWVVLISLADGLWVVGTVLLIVLAFGVLKPMGIVVLLGVASLVAFFGVRQFQGVRQMTS
ncbi:MAG: hypothetical protein J0M33_26890 [Anaerolineae bacterium]|nr:hypothetical protein [Anaerolineae bacterium]